jgi:GxxExxY protein
MAEEQHGMASILLEGELTSKIIGVFFDCYNETGHGFPEFVHRGVLAVALAEAGLNVKEEVHVPFHYHGKFIAKFILDIIVNDRIVIEVKATQNIEKYQIAQVLHYLKATNYEVGLLLNFGKEPQFRRVVCEKARQQKAERVVEIGDADVRNTGRGVR